MRQCLVAIGVLLTIGPPSVALTEQVPLPVAFLDGLTAMRAEAIVWGGRVPVNAGRLEKLVKEKLLTIGLVAQNGAHTLQVGDPSLVVNLMMAEGASCAFRVLLRVSEEATLKRTTSWGKAATMRAVTWRSPICFSNTSLDPELCAQRIEACVVRLLAEFATEFAKTNGPDE